MELKDTVEGMLSADYKERFKAEYYQLEIRVEKLCVFVDKYKAGELNFTPACSLELLKEQLRTMGALLNILQTRARVEDIEL